MECLLHRYCPFQFDKVRCGLQPGSRIDCIRQMHDDETPISPLWLLSDRLSVIEAALLLTGAEPQGKSAFVENWNDGDKPAGYLAARRGIMSGIQRKEIEGGVEWERVADSNGFSNETDELDYGKSWVDTVSLRAWLERRGFREGFFFIGLENALPGYLDRSHARYAPKLAAAVEAWERFDDDASLAGTAKQKLGKWLRLNAGRFGLVDDDGKPTESVIEEIAKVANWARAGGAPRQKKESDPEPDDEIPF